jgi:hypothetical protein
MQGQNSVVACGGGALFAGFVPMSARPPFYIVLGPYRSGTSLVSRLAQQLGANAGPESALYEPTAWNPSGYLQRPDITAFNTRLITGAGGTLTDPPSPAQIADRTDPGIFASLDLGWARTGGAVLAKDPRFCFTLLAWQRHGVFAGHELALIRISRGVEETVGSALAHYDVRHYCGNSPDTARRVITTYDENARWHASTLGAPCHSVVYEQLVADPAGEVAGLAAFMRVTDPARIAAAVAATLEGKSRMPHDLAG